MSWVGSKGKEAYDNSEFIKDTVATADELSKLYGTGALSYLFDSPYSSTKAQVDDPGVTYEGEATYVTGMSWLGNAVTGFAVARLAATTINIYMQPGKRGFKGASKENLALYREKYKTEIDSASTFKPKGLDALAAKSYLDSTEGKLLLKELHTFDSIADEATIIDRAVRQLATGTAIPELQIISSPLYKIVPSGKGVGDKSPFFTTMVEIQSAKKSGMSLAEYFGLPINSNAEIYDIYQMTPNAPARVFISKVAPTSELDGLVEMKGGAKQYIVPNRNLWNSPIPFGSISEQ